MLSTRTTTNKVAKDNMEGKCGFKHKNKNNYVANHMNKKKMRLLSARTRANEDAKHKNKGK